MSEAAAPPDVVEGVSLERYAGVIAALAEGFDAESVLAQEGIPPETWPDASLGWKTKLALGGADSPVFAAYRGKIAEAEDCLHRPVPPLDSDPAAWAGFLAIMASHGDPGACLENMGLGLNDLARLQRIWERRTKSDEALRDRLAQLAKARPPARLTPRPGPKALRPFPWSRPGQAPSHAPTPEVESGAQVESGAAVVPAAVKVEIQLPSYLRSPAIRPAAPVPPTPPVPAGTAFGLVLPIRESLPFREAAPPAEAPAPKPPPEKHALPSGTAPLLDLPIRPATPFEPKPAVPAVPVQTPKPGLADRKEFRLADVLARGAKSSDKPAEKAPERPAPPPAPTAGVFPAPTAGVSPAPTAGVSPAPTAGVSPAPAAAELSLEQHAALSLEIALAPDRAGEILVRYRIDPQIKDRLDARYRALVSSSPAAYKAWRGAYDAHYAWLRSRTTS